jgi:hypothetical protein
MVFRASENFYRLRIREGIRTITEQTMTFANIQNLVIRQNPLQRLLGFADLHVRTAGGGGKTNEQGGSGSDEEKHRVLHLAVFRGVDNATEIRDLILERLKQIRTSGLGDPEERLLDQEELPQPPESAEEPLELTNLIAELQRETAALRAAVRASAEG